LNYEARGANFQITKLIFASAFWFIFRGVDPGGGKGGNSPQE